MPDSAANSSPQWGFASAAVALGVGVAIGIAELLAQARPLPRVQHVDLSELRSGLLDGVPIWEPRDPRDDRRGEECAGRPEVLLLGSSIFFGSGVAREESLTPALQAQLPEWCVRNLSRPAYTFSNQAAELQRHLGKPSTPPQVVVWEMWTNSHNGWVVRGSQAYNFSSLTGMAPEVPNPLGLSTGIHLMLFDWLAVYRHVVVHRADAHVPPLFTERQRVLGEVHLSPIVDALAARGTRVVLAMMPGLDAPFDESARDPKFRYAPLVEAVHGRVALVPVAERFAQSGLDHEAVRVDSCCHYNAAGLAELADLLATAIGDPAPDSRPAAEAQTEAAPQSAAPP